MLRIFWFKRACGSRQRLLAPLDRLKSKVRSFFANRLIQEQNRKTRRFALPGAHDGPPCARRKFGDLLQRIFMRVLRMNGFALVEREFPSADGNRLRACGHKMYFDSALRGIPRCTVRKGS